jgi:hypothetical protein
MREISGVGIALENPELEEFKNEVLPILEAGIHLRVSRINKCSGHIEISSGRSVWTQRRLDLPLKCIHEGAGWQDHT